MGPARVAMSVSDSLVDVLWPNDNYYYTGVFEDIANHGKQHV